MVFVHFRLLNFSMSNDYESLGVGLPGRKSQLVSSSMIFLSINMGATQTLAHAIIEFFN